MAREIDLPRILRGMTVEEASLFAEAVLVFHHIDQLLGSGKAASKTLSHTDADQIQNVADRVHKALDEMRMARIDFDKLMPGGNDKIASYMSQSFQDLVHTSQIMLGVYLTTMVYRWSVAVDPDSPYKKLVAKPAPVPAPKKPQKAESPPETVEAPAGEPEKQEEQPAGEPGKEPTTKSVHPKAVLFPFGLGMPKRKDAKQTPKSQ